MSTLETVRETQAAVLLNDIVLLNRELLEQIAGLNLFISAFSAEVRANDYFLIKRIQNSLNAQKDCPLDEVQVKARIFALNICEKILQSHKDEPVLGPDRCSTFKSQAHFYHNGKEALQSHGNVI